MGEHACHGKADSLVFADGRRQTSAMKLRENPTPYTGEVRVKVKLTNVRRAIRTPREGVREGVKP